MSLLFDTPNGGHIFIDRISEIVRDLPAGFIDAYPDRFASSRKHQLAASDMVLQRQFGLAERIERNERGAPTLKNAHVSISHTRDHLALIVHGGERVAIDIEVKTRNVQSIVPRYTTKEEVIMAADAFDEFPEIFVWSCKEALFKYLRLEGVHFKEQLQLLAHTPGDRVRSIWEVNHPKFQGRLCVNSSIFGELMVSYLDSADAMHEHV